MDSPFQLKALIFDLMGTCCDWNTSILMALKGCPPLPLVEHDLPKFAADWRSDSSKKFITISSAGLPAEDIDITHRRVLDELLDDRHVDSSVWDDNVRNRLVTQWHHQKAWSDAIGGLLRLMKKKFM